MASQHMRSMLTSLIYTTGNEVHLGGGETFPRCPFVSSEVETPIVVAPRRGASRLRSMRTGRVGEAAIDRPHYPLNILAIAFPLACLRSEENTSQLQSLMRILYALFCSKHKNTNYA